MSLFSYFARQSCKWYCSVNSDDFYSLGLDSVLVKVVLMTPPVRTSRGVDKLHFLSLQYFRPVKLPLKHEWTLGSESLCAINSLLTSEEVTCCPMKKAVGSCVAAQVTEKGSVASGCSIAALCWALPPSRLLHMAHFSSTFVAEPPFLL